MAENNGTPIYDAMGNFTGYYDPTPGETKPSPDFAKPNDEKAKEPKGGPIVTAKQIKMGTWTLYAEGDNIYAKSPSGKILQVVMFDPNGITEKVKPNKLSDGSDGSKDSIGGNNVPLTAKPVSVENKDVAQSPSQQAAGNPQAAFNGVPMPLPNPVINIPWPLFNSDFIGSFWPESRQVASEYLQRPIDETEWNDLIAAINAECDYTPSGEVVDIVMPAWVAGTILNRARLSGQNITAILNQADQFMRIGPNEPSFILGPSPAAEAAIHNSLVNWLPSVPTNNYHYENANPYLLPTGECLPTYRNGIQGVLVGQILVFPGARWP